MRRRAGVFEQRRGRWYLATRLPIPGPGGGYVGLVGISKDISERKLAGDRLARGLDALWAVDAAVAQGDLTLRGVDQAEQLATAIARFKIEAQGERR